MARKKAIRKGAVRVIFAPLQRERDNKTESWVDGMAKVPGRTIWLDPRTEFVGIIIHELLHVRHPSWTEDEVWKETRLRMKQMTWKEQARLLREVCAAAIIQGEKIGDAT
jgi:hypothetical protein